MQTHNTIKIIPQSQDYGITPDSVLKLDNLTAMQALEIRREELNKGNKVNISTYGDTTHIEIFFPNITVIAEPLQNMQNQRW